MMIKGYVIDTTSNLIICASCLAWGREGNLRNKIQTAMALRDAFAVKHMDTCSCIASGNELFSSFILEQASLASECEISEIYIC